MLSCCPIVFRMKYSYRALHPQFVASLSIQLQKQHAQPLALRPIYLSDIFSLTFGCFYIFMQFLTEWQCLFHTQKVKITPGIRDLYIQCAVGRTVLVATRVQDITKIIQVILGMLNECMHTLLFLFCKIACHGHDSCGEFPKPPLSF